MELQKQIDRGQSKFIRGAHILRTLKLLPCCHEGARGRGGSRSKRKNQRGKRHKKQRGKSASDVVTPIKCLKSYISQRRYCFALQPHTSLHRVQTQSGCPTLWMKDRSMILDKLSVASLAAIEMKRNPNAGAGNGEDESTVDIGAFLEDGDSSDENAGSTHEDVQSELDEFAVHYEEGDIHHQKLKREMFDFWDKGELKSDPKATDDDDFKVVIPQEEKDMADWWGGQTLRKSEKETDKGDDEDFVVTRPKDEKDMEDWWGGEKLKGVPNKKGKSLMDEPDETETVKKTRDEKDMENWFSGKKLKRVPDEIGKDLMDEPDEIETVKKTRDEKDMENWFSGKKLKRVPGPTPDVEPVHVEPEIPKEQKVMNNWWGDK